MDISKKPPDTTPIHRVINFYLKRSNVFFNGKRYRPYEKDNDDLIFLQRVSRIYSKTLEDLTTTPLEELVEEAAVFYILDHIFKPCIDPHLFKEKTLILENYFQAYLRLEKLGHLDSKEMEKGWIIKIAQRIVVDYQATVFKLLEVFDIKSHSMQMHLIKTCLLNPNHTCIRNDFWESCFDPLISSEPFFILDRSQFDKAIDKLALAPQPVDEWGALYLKECFFHELWNHDFLHEETKHMLAKVTYYPFDDHREWVQHASKALFFSIKEDPHLNFVTHHKLLLPYWNRWIELIIPFFNKGESPSYRSIEDLKKKNCDDKKHLKDLIVRHWGIKSSLLRFLTPPMTESDHTETHKPSIKMNVKEGYFNEENKLIWLSLAAFFFASHDYKDEDITRHLEPLEQLRCHPNQTQKRIATYYYLYSNTEDGFRVIFEDFTKAHIPFIPALFCAEYLSKHPRSSVTIRNISLTFFSSKYRHDRRHQSYFCSWLQRLSKVEKLDEDEVSSLLKMLSGAKTRKILFTGLETIEMFFNLHLFRALTSYHDLDLLLNDADQVILNKFDILDTENPKSFKEAMNTFRQPRYLFIYYGKIKSWGHEKHQKIAVDFFHRFLISLSQGTFAKDRYDIGKNGVLKKFHEFSPETFEDWKAGATFDAEDLPNVQQPPMDGPHHIIVNDSDDPSDLFLSGTEVLSSCQNIHTDIVLSSALLGYLWNGNNRIFVVRDPETKEIIARAIHRIIPDLNGNIVIVLEKIHYRCPKAHEACYASAITQAALERAKSLKLPLVTIRTEGLSWDAHLLAEDLYCPFDYSDASVGEGYPTYEGTIKIHMTQVTCLFKYKAVLEDTL